MPEDAMAYSLDQFIADCRTTLSRDPGPAGREQVRTDLERLLANPEFISAYCGDDQPRGLKVLYEDPKLGFQVLAHINDKARISPPHDHGASWAIYGQARGETMMNDWAVVEPASEARTGKVRHVRTYPLKPGMAHVYNEGDLHSPRRDGPTRLIRIEGTNMDKVKRLSYERA
jgi:predicted metal-dependent enzyme (double-stranded beta helix superfamily)